MEVNIANLEVTELTNGVTYMMKRRTFVGMLGLAPASAVGAESFLLPNEAPYTPRAVAGSTNDEVIATALENIAQEIRAKVCTVESLSTNSEIHNNAIAGSHEVRIRIYYEPERKRNA